MRRERRLSNAVIPFGLVAIGRNEGERLKQCLRSAAGAAIIIYVDSGSSDGSVEWTRSAGAHLVELARATPFTAARARNHGFRRMRELAPQISYVQFIDGDCELDREWPGHAIRFLEQHQTYCAAVGRLRERFPDRSIYNRLCDDEWNTPIGDALACGGIVMLRVDAFENVQGFRDELIAGEEPELCVRLRSAGWYIRRLDFEMAKHDANMKRFGQWWRRTVRSGYAFAQGAALHGGPPECHWVWESCRSWLWAICLPLTIIISVILFGAWAWLLLLIYPAQIVKQTLRSDGAMGHRILLGFFQVLARFPEACGQLLYLRDRLAARQAQLIEYK
ncbi:Glycosyltransferase, GT2 family [Bradyrhizobium erythrophlei]|uniref:Glycosyltransferase, GT2 family n=1 Tax=Bradyrhizobium erythrophlei TaxID=1437360 RepID=A0A1M5TE97_9BRAD|nr:Glycosyltransferase, GT2 family [Bradyrhizobium erythrophlei]